MEQPDYVIGLLEEREGYVRRGLADRVALVDAELASFGVAVETAKPKERASRKPAETR